MVHRLTVRARAFSTQQRPTPPVFEYSAPKDDSRNFESQQQFIKRYIILLPFALYSLYKVLFTTKNDFS